MDKVIKKLIKQINKETDKQEQLHLLFVLDLKILPSYTKSNKSKIVSFADYEANIYNQITLIS